MRLLLFDIDGTLINSNPAGRLAMSAALEQMFGTAGALDGYPMGGKTDASIVTDVLTSAGVPLEEIQQKMASTFLLMAELAREIYPAWNLTACPGVLPLLAELRRRDDIMLGLLTGNAQATAPLKLSGAGIDPAQFVVGAFGSDDLDRNQLPQIALERASRLTGNIIPGDNAVIIGDTPADVQCARAGGTLAIAVATGWHTAAALLQHEPDHLFNDMANVPAVMRVLLGEYGENEQRR